MKIVRQETLNINYQLCSWSFLFFNKISHVFRIWFKDACNDQQIHIFYLYGSWQNSRQVFLDYYIYEFLGVNKGVVFLFLSLLIKTLIFLVWNSVGSLFIHYFCYYMIVSHVSILMNRSNLKVFSYFSLLDCVILVSFMVCLFIWWSCSLFCR